MILTGYPQSHSLYCPVSSYAQLNVNSLAAMSSSYLRHRELQMWSLSSTHDGRIFHRLFILTLLGPTAPASPGIPIKFQDPKVRRLSWRSLLCNIPLFGLSVSAL